MLSLEVDIDKYHHLISCMFIATHCFQKMQCQNNTDNKIMMNEGNKYFHPLCYNFAPTQRGAKNLHGAKKCVRFARSLKYFAPAPMYNPVGLP